MVLGGGSDDAEFHDHSQITVASTVALPLIRGMQVPRIFLCRNRTAARITPVLNGGMANPYFVEGHQ
jgi:hypothetical protein